MKFAITLLTLAGIFFSFNGEAQLTKGQKMLGGSLSYINGKTENDLNGTVKASQFEIEPAIGFGLGENWIIGALLGYNYTNQKTDREAGSIDTEERLNIFGVGAWVRKFYPLTTQFGIYGQGNAEVGLGKGKRLPETDMFSTTADVTSYSADIQPGFYFLPGKKIIIEATFGTIGYTSVKYNYKENTPFSDSKASSFNLSVTDGLSIGVKFIL